MDKGRGQPFVHTHKLYSKLVLTLAAGPLAPATDRMSAG